jgi:hypothetical protein
MTMSYPTTPPARARNDVRHEEAAVPGEVRRWRALTFVLVHGAFQTGLGPALTPEQAGEAIVDLASGPGRDQDAYLLTAAGLSPVQH